MQKKIKTKDHSPGEMSDSNTNNDNQVRLLFAREKRVMFFGAQEIYE